MKIALMCATLFATGIAGVLSAQDGVYTDPTKADDAFKRQGEYVASGEVDGQKFDMGIQVIALGDHKFQGVIYLGGLPGAGWNGGEPTNHRRMRKCCLMAHPLRDGKTGNSRMMGI